MERMSALDAEMFFAEQYRTPMHIASVTVLEGPAPAYEDLVAMVRARMMLIPRYLQKVVKVPLNLGRPVWADDPHFQLDYHLRHTAVPPPGGPEEFRQVADRVLALPLDMGKPPWELWCVEGLADGHWAIIAKVHHCVVDGVAASDLMTVLFDLSPETPAEGAQVVPLRSPEPPPSALRLAFDGLRDSITGPLRQVPGIPARILRGGGVRAVLGFSTGLPRSVERMAHHAPDSLPPAAGPHRSWVWTHADLDEVRRIRQVLGGTVNDIVLAAVTHGLRELLASQGRLEAETVLRSLVPVSVRGADEHGVLDNKVSGLIASLPCGEPDALERLQLIREQMDDLKSTHQAVSADALIKLAGAAPTMLSLSTRAALSALRPLFQVVTTNVPGPPFPLYVLGHRVLELYPYVPLAAGVAVSIGIFSYTGRLYFGVTADFDGPLDLEVLTKGIEAGFADLAARTEVSGGRGFS
ncbi:wax ester/triacylglycerol synthase family O-acyltransferase [Actinomadura barringtoniae]|uniref:Diacylglycerol O-acyltransferase n=1 Tax=Actinomadura barringtoniae TaxID=1427535 RepID=A0A939T6P7_9ACTN|nr:wax ester/triacylglycerol synthase family O-acyltransferase [Actinomadura barringtoniae]MBO2455196.1 wax ester/triacylglycerol synthase family O-acyltransferase [Actinomadura barringtoniae]